MFQKFVRRHETKKKDKKNCEFKNLFLTFWEKNKAKDVIATET